MLWNLVSPPKVEDRLKDFENSVPRRGFWTAEVGGDRNRKSFVNFMHYKLASSTNKQSWDDQIKEKARVRYVQVQGSWLCFEDVLA
jgi:hypothetical protein